jgi:hypothetical protein
MGCYARLDCGLKPELFDDVAAPDRRVPVRGLFE